MENLQIAEHEAALPLKGDFLVDNLYTFETGGKGKSSKQLEAIENGFIISDELDTGINNKIPLWLFGMLY